MDRAVNRITFPNVREKGETVGTYYDDNFGHWDSMDDPDMARFYHETQKKNVRKKCKGCEEWVRIQPHYAYCNSCADKIEKGWDF